MPTPWRKITPRAANASVLNSRVNVSPNDAASLWTLSPSTAPLRAALSSASHEDRAILDWCLHHQLMVWLPQQTTPPLELLRVSIYPAQSESVYTTIHADSSWNLYLIATLGFPFRYRIMRLMVISSPPLGFDIRLEVTREAKLKSGRSSAT